MVTLPTRNGGTVEITRSGALVDIHVRDATGRTVATVTRRAGEEVALLAPLYRPK
ncbi:hypothetical protein ACIBTP_41975 [Streptomyces avidinii]|uniref:hypothetical protein n=1 Tax=Streptomyces avidinii TaxID=1895 RepID=UPI0037B90E18